MEGLVFALILFYVLEPHTLFEPAGVFHLVVPSV